MAPLAQRKVTRNMRSRLRHVVDSEGVCRVLAEREEGPPLTPVNIDPPDEFEWPDEWAEGSG